MESANRNKSQISVSHNPTLVQKRAVSAKDILAELKAGLSDNAREQKCQLKQGDLKNIFGKLISPIFVAEEEPRGRNKLVKDQTISRPQGNIEKIVPTTVFPNQIDKTLSSPAENSSRTDICTTPPFRRNQTVVRDHGGKLLMKSKTSSSDTTETRLPSGKLLYKSK